MAKWLVFVSMLAAAVSVSSRSIAANLTVATLAPNDLVITEYLANPIGITDGDGEYFEIFNTTGNLIDLGGLVVRDDGSNSFTVTALTIAAQSFAVFSSSDGASLGIIPDYVYGGSMSLTNKDDEIGLYRQDGMAIHQLTYDDGDFFGAGIAHELDRLDWATQTVLNGPATGTDFIAATAMLPFDNTGSPGFAGNTNIDLAQVPLPASVWMFGSALGMLGWARRKASETARFTLANFAFAHFSLGGINNDQQTGGNQSTLSHGADDFTVTDPVSLSPGSISPWPGEPTIRLRPFDGRRIRCS